MPAFWKHSSIFPRCGLRLARHVALNSGCATSTPALTVDQLRGSCFETAAQGVTATEVGDASVAPCGGMENASVAPLQVSENDVRWGVALGKELKLGDSLWDGLTDAHVICSTGFTAENLAEKHGTTQEECDECAIRGHTGLEEMRTKKCNKKPAQSNPIQINIFHSLCVQSTFGLEMAPAEVEACRGTQVVDSDEHPCPGTALEKMGKLLPLSEKDGIVPAANTTSKVCDRAGSVILASGKAVKQHNLKPLVRLVSHGVTGCDPTIMGAGSVKATQQAVERGGLSLGGALAAQLQCTQSLMHMTQDPVWLC